jgi:hypothetical protein
MPPKGSNEGGNTSSMSYSPARRKRMAAKRKREERRWAMKAGPVEIRQATADDIKRNNKQSGASDGSQPIHE